MILIVDDNADARRLLGLLLQSAAYESAEVASGMQAIRFLESNIPELAILDLDMPGMDGRTLLKTMRDDPRWCNIPVIIYTAEPSSRRQADCLRLGAKDFVIKGQTDWSDFQAIIDLHARNVPPAEVPEMKRLSA